jgi:hypothetical protein
MIGSAVSAHRLNEILEASSEVNVSSINKNQSQTNNRDTQAEIRERVLQNIEESKTAREASNYKDFAEFENRFKGISNFNLRTGTGTSGEGLSLDDVPEGVFRDISPDDSAVFGYSPNKGTRYDSPDYDFTNEDFARRNQAIRKDYLDGSETLREILKL